MEAIPNRNFYARFTIALSDLLESFPDILDVLDSNETWKGQNLKERFIIHYSNYEVAGETPAEFKLFVNQTFNEYSNLYLKLLELYENTYEWKYREDSLEITKHHDESYNNSGSGNNATVDYDLATREEADEYPNSREKTDRSYTEDNTGNEDDTSTHKMKYGYNPVSQREEYAKALRDVTMEFIEKFRDCFLRRFY